MTFSWNESFIGMDTLGTIISNFLINIVPGILYFSLAMAVVAGIVLIFKGIFSRIRVK